MRLVRAAEYFVTAFNGRDKFSLLDELATRHISCQHTGTHLPRLQDETEWGAKKNEKACSFEGQSIPHYSQTSAFTNDVRREHRACWSRLVAEDHVYFLMTTN